jgi:hypothetical protein
MSLARAWTRQLYGASSAALIVPSAMLGALLVLALGGGFGQVGVLGQIFAGPPVPSVGAGVAPSGGAGAAAPSRPTTLATALRRSTSGSRHRATPVAPVRSGSHRSGGALSPAAGVAPIVVATGGPAPARPTPTGSGPTAPTPPPPARQPSPRPTIADRVVKVVTPVTEQVPAPAGPVVTQAVEAAGRATDRVLPPGVGAGAPTQGAALP